MATYTSNYAWTKPSGGDPVDIEVLNDNLDNQDSIVHQAFLDLAPVFSTANTYAVKDVVLYDNKVWICHTAVTTAGAWTGSTNWTQTTVGETGGVATYAELPDKPSINGNEVSGNKTGAQLGLQNALTFDNVPTDGSNNPVKSGGVYSAEEAIRQWTTASAKSVSGNPITLLDGSARNAEGLAVACEPKQNLHGYDHPWAGGAGKNKLPMTVDGIKSANTSGTWSGNAYTHNGVTFALNTDDGGNIIGVKVSGTASANAYLEIPVTTPNEGQIISGCPSGGSQSTYNLGFTTVGYPAYVDTGSGYTLNSPIRGVSTKASIYVYSGYNASNLLFYPMLELGSTVTTFAPYTNECPITGYTECVVDVKDEDETTQDTATIAFGQTVYGGSVDFKTGDGASNYGFVDLSTLTWTYQSAWGSWYADLVGIKRSASITSKANVFAEKYKTIAPSEAISASGEIGIGVSDSYDRIIVKNGSSTAAPSGGLCYELATPIELTLTPAELELLKGYNYITTNGTTIALDYLPDSLLAEAENYVDAKIPPAPSSDGTYVLTCTVTDGTSAYTWESAT